MHPEFDQVLWIAAFVTATPFLMGAAALFLEGSSDLSDGTQSGKAAASHEERPRP